MASIYKLQLRMASFWGCKKKTCFIVRLLNGYVLKGVLSKSNCNLKWYASSIACICKTWWNPKNKTTFDFCQYKLVVNFVNELASSKAMYEWIIP